MLAYFLVVCYSLSRVIFAPAFPCKPACGEKRGVYEKSALRARLESLWLQLDGFGKTSSILFWLATAFVA